tara:strand:- start:326 stop:520 length:195 start_codon:yes stop_codon:yes gene_type:complete
MKPTYIPDIEKQLFDNNHVNVKGWNDTEEINEQSENLKRNSMKIVFEAYYFDKALLPISAKAET